MDDKIAAMDALCMPSVFLNVSLLLLVALLTGGVDADAQEFSTGEKVKVEWAGKWLDAKVIEAKANGWVKVAFTMNGVRMTPTLPPSKLQGRGSSRTKSGSSRTPPSRTGGGTDWSSVREIKPGRTSKWRVTQDALDAAAPVQTRPIALPVANKNQALFEKPKRMLLLRDLNQVWVTFWDSRSGRDGEMRLERIDVAGGKSLGSVGLPPGGLPIDATTNGTKILWRSGTFGMTGAERLQVLKVDGTAAKRIAEFSPYAGERSSSRRGVYYARFVGDRHAITCNNYGRLALWKIGSSRPVYTIRLKLCLKPALSANDKHLALATEQGVYVLDPLSGRTMGSLPGNVHPNSTFSFRHDGLRLACLMQKELTVWDLRNGRQIRNIALPWKTTSEQLDWVADDYVMADAKYLIDVDRGAGRWYYRGISKGTCGVLGSRVWHVQKGRSVHMLCSVVLPHAEVRKSAGPAPKAGSSSANSGTPVSVKVSIRASSRDRSRIAQSLSSQLKKNGYKVASRQPLVLEASITPGKDAHVLYHKAWEFKSIHKVFKAQIHRLAFLQNGKILWEKKKTVRPHSRVEMRKGQSIEQAIAESLKPDLAFFTKTPIPTHVSASSSGKRGGSTGAVGRSKITDKGVVKD